MNKLSLIEVYNELLLESVQKSAIEKAISDKDVVTIYYEGDETISRGWRTVNPCVFGVNKSGNSCLRAYQTQGVSDSKDKPMWRMFRTDRITGWSKTLKKFDNLNKDMMRDYNTNGDLDMPVIYKQVKF